MLVVCGRCGNALTRGSSSRRNREEDEIGGRGGMGEIGGAEESKGLQEKIKYIICYLAKLISKFFGFFLTRLARDPSK